MPRPSPPALLRRAVREHRRLERQATATGASDPADVLRLGSAVLMHGLFEEAHLLAAHPLLDPSVRAGLLRENEELGESVDLLEELLATAAPSDDLTALTSALYRRLRDHVERDRRVLYQPLERW